jgi:hypothetical protein
MKGCTAGLRTRSPKSHTQWIVPTKKGSKRSQKGKKKLGFEGHRPSRKRFLFWTPRKKKLLLTKSFARREKLASREEGKRNKRGDGLRNRRGERRTGSGRVGSDRGG